jgi:hypothetical protein
MEPELISINDASGILGLDCGKADSASLVCSSSYTIGHKI